MGVVLSVSAVSKRFGAQPLFENLTLAIHDGQRIGLTGPNGAGKSTLVKILAGLEPPDSGARSVRKQAVIAYVEQDSFFPEGISVREVLEHALREAPLTPEEKNLRIEMEASRAGLNDFDMPAASLSGGWRKRLSIVAGLVREPAVILLDEPTNHLDIDGIIWLQGALKSAECAALFISHDRYFLEQVATHMGEINKTYPDGIYFVEGNYTRFLERRADFLLAQQRYQESLASRVRREIEWLRRGAKARTTKAKARIDEANRLIDELAEVSGRNAERATAGLAMNASQRQTKRLISAQKITKRYSRLLFENLDVTLTAGMRLGLVGGNGCGKSTLLRILAGEIPPDSGLVERAEHLKIVVLDQNRRLTDETVTLRRALCEAGDTVIFQGRPIHVVAWAKRFLFQEEQLVQPVAQLSGGERARVLLANLMLQPADVLFLDEPTNDLDIPTLEVLEENLLDFSGAMVLVTHDRYLLDRIANTVLALNGDGTAGLYAEYSQWEQDRAKPSVRKETAKPTAAPPAPPKKKTKLSYLDQREWDSIEDRIHAAEAELEAAHFSEIEAKQAAVDALYQRWAELEGKLNS